MLKTNWEGLRAFPFSLYFFFYLEVIINTLKAILVIIGVFLGKILSKKVVETYNKAIGNM